jgi:chemotaxis protein histidine kinase CheA
MTLEQQIQDLIEAASRQLSGQVSERLQGIATEIVQAASAQHVSEVRELRMAAEAESAKRSEEAVAAAQAEHARRLEEAVAAAHQEGARRIDDAVASVKAEQARSIEDAVAAVRFETSSHHDALTASIRADAARSQADAVAGALADAEQQLARTREEAEQQLARTREEAEQHLAGSVDAARREVHQTLERTLVETRASERHVELEQMERLVEAVRRLDTARSLTDALEVLVDVAAKEAPRVAVFMARGTRVLGWKGAGLPLGTDLKQMDMSAAEGGLIPRAMRATAALTTSESPDPALMTTPFGVLPADAAGVAIALRVCGEPVAVLYADDAADHRREVPSAWPEAVELLARHAARCLEVLTVVRVSRPAFSAPAMAAASAPPPSPRFAPQARAHAAISDTDDDAGRRYAKLLVSEIKLYHEAAVSQGRRDANILQRLREEIDRARTLYDERVPHAVRSRADYFDQELVRTLANGDSRLLGQV